MLAAGACHAAQREQRRHTCLDGGDGWWAEHRADWTERKPKQFWQNEREGEKTQYRVRPAGGHKLETAFAAARSLQPLREALRRP